jgi:hypothetical protein
MDPDLRDYIDSTAEASAKTRVGIYTLIVASVLLLGGALNSFQSNWMKQRLRALSDPASEYSKAKIKDISGITWTNLTSTNATNINTQNSLYLAVHQKLSDNLFRQYVANTYTVNVPFFGVSFDINDLGILGGIAIVVLMAILYFSLNREYTNLLHTFRVAEQKGLLKHVYTILAMKQVLARPRLPMLEERVNTEEYLAEGSVNRRSGLRAVPRVVIAIPVVILMLVFIQDLSTNVIGSSLSKPYTMAVTLFTLTSLIISSYLCFQCWTIWQQLDHTWKKYLAKLSTADERH